MTSCKAYVSWVVCRKLRSVRDVRAIAARRRYRVRPSSIATIVVASILSVYRGDPAAQNAPAGWFQDLNAYRAAAGLAPVTENITWSEGAAQHARYTVKTDTFSSTENPGSPWYTPAGAAAAPASIGMVHATSTTTDRSALDRWMRSPFTAIPILNPRLRSVGFGSYREADGGIQMSAWLDIARGIGEMPPGTTFPLTWPVNGAAVPAPFDDCAPGTCGDFPSVTETCPGFVYPMGFPLILQLGPTATAPAVSGSGLVRQSLQPVEHCVFDETTFRHSDASQRTIGQAWLRMNHAVVIIPKSPLAAGIRYTASVTANGTKYEWSFDVTGAGSTPAAGTGDLDGDGLPGSWESAFGLNSGIGTGNDGASGDPDGDGSPNLTDYRENTHPRGFRSRYFAEGATSGFFDMGVALVNPTNEMASVLLRFLLADGTTRSQALSIPALTRRTLRPRELSGLDKAEFSTVIESDMQVIVDRTMTWDADGYGSHAETSIGSPASTWYLAEGATHSGFDLFYLVQNPNRTPVTVHVKYLLLSGPAIEKSYLIAANSRFNIWVNEEARSDPALAALAEAEISAVLTVTSGGPVIVERAMYLASGGRVFGAGHNSAAVTAPALNWFLAEGATGTYFDLFVLLANPNTQDAHVAATYLMPDGTTIQKSYVVAGNTRRTVWVDLEDARLADTAVSTAIAVTNGVPVIVERAMWWPGPTAATWQEAHNSPGATAAGTKWALAEGELGGSRGIETYILIANTSGFAGFARVALLFEDGTTAQRTYNLRPNSRFNVQVATEFPEAAGKQFGAVIESLGAVPAQLVVERATYSNSGGIAWAAGTNALATRLQ